MFVHAVHVVLCNTVNTELGNDVCTVRHTRHCFGLTLAMDGSLCITFIQSSRASLTQQFTTFTVFRLSLLESSCKVSQVELFLPNYYRYCSFVQCFCFFVVIKAALIVVIMVHCCNHGNRPHPVHAVVQW